MSHFYARIPTSARRTIATARGHRTTGIAAEVLTAEGGVRVTIRHRNGRDIVTVERIGNPHTGGRIGAGSIVAAFDIRDPYTYECHGPADRIGDELPPVRTPATVTFTPYPVAATCPATGAEYGTAE
jgi:hypothetical protein